MGRGNGESITAKAMTSMHTNVSKTHEHAAFVVYRTVEYECTHMLRGACARLPNRPYALTCLHVCARKTGMADESRSKT